ncbi:AAA family ATPase [Candidatus Parcubacteria bacterium]|nr:AAA family ATPase [Candidatus Parcubacteria bacterium]
MTQQEALDILKLGHNVYLTGPPGSGKTFLLNKYISYLKKNRRKVAVTASTGIAATHMNGITIHSWSGLGIKEKLTELDIKKLLKKSYLRKKFKDTNVLIIDEVSMLHSFQFDIVNCICQAFKGNVEAFGGMQVVCSGDFFQLPPVQKQGKPKFIIESDIWPKMNMKICYLAEQHRQKDNELADLLNHIRNNNLQESRRILLNREDEEKTFPLAPVRLYTHNIDVDAINNYELNKINEEEIVYHMKSNGNENIVAILKKTCLAPERLALKQGAKVMFVKNNFDAGYMNGTLGKIIGFNDEGLPIVETFRGERIEVAPARWMIEEDNMIKAEINQFPLRLAWAITIHKSQGMNLDAAEINLSKSFLKGMGYVALSRLSSLAGLKLKGLNDLALLVNEDIMELDETLKQLSQKAVEFIEEANKRKLQKRFLESLPKGGAKSISTYMKTKALVDAKMGIKKIAKQRELTEATIMSHLEKLVKDRADINLEYLRPPECVLEEINLAFQESRCWQLAPARAILGDTFSYDEIRLARLFLEN